MRNLNLSAKKAEALYSRGKKKEKNIYKEYRFFVDSSQK